MFLRSLFFMNSILLSATLHAAEPSDMAKRFGARENVRDISISPSGRRVAFVMPMQVRALAVEVVDLEHPSAPVAILKSDSSTERLNHCQWATDERLICQVFLIGDNGVTKLGFTRVIAINADGTKLQLLSTTPGAHALGIMQNGGEVIDWTGGDQPGTALMTHEFVPERTIGTHLAQTRDGLGVDRIDTLTLKRVLVEPPKADAVDYISDGLGMVRVMGTRQTGSSGMESAATNYYFRRKGANNWTSLSTTVNGPTGLGMGFTPVAVDSDLDAVYGFDSLDGRSALYRIALDGSMKRDLVTSRPDVDVDQLIRIGRQQRVVGVSFTTDRVDATYFDPELKALAASLSRALPGERLINFVDATADEKQLIIYVGSDSDPGKYYHFDKTTKTLAELLPVRPQLAGIKLASVSPIHYSARDGTRIPAYLTLPPGSNGKNLPGIVMPHGGPGDRDTWGFDWWAQFFANRGFAVIQPEFRGSSGFGAEWYKKNGFQSWRTAIGDITDAGRYLTASGIAAPGKLAIVGWSYGGYAALQSAVLEPDLFKAVIAVAPVTDLETLRNEARNFTNFALTDKFIGHGPHLAEGSPAQNADKIMAPVLMFHGDTDQNVGVGESRLMAARLKSAGKLVDYVEYRGLDHQLLDDNSRADMLDRSDRFLRTSMGLPVIP